MTVVCYYTEKNPQHAVDIIQRSLNELVEWGKTARLTFNPLKTVAILFTRANKLEFPNKLKMEGIEIEYSQNTRYLGVQIDYRLAWNIHFAQITKRAKQYLMQLMGALNKRWGPKPKLVRWIYTAIVRPMQLWYGAII